MWKHRLHVCFHRIVGGSIAMVGLLNELKQIDLSQLPLVGAHSGAIVAGLGLIIVALEFLPILGSLLDGAEDHEEEDHK